MLRPHHPLTPWGFVLPALLLFAFAVLAPTAMTVWYSTWSWNTNEPLATRPAGLRNYEVALTRDVRFLGAPGNQEFVARAARDGDRHPLLASSLANNLYYLLLTLVFEVGVGLVLAVLCHRQLRAVKVVRALLFTPMVLALTIIALLWRFLLRADDGIVNVLLRAAGLAGLIPDRGWFGDQSWALTTISLISGWVYCGFYMVLFTAGLERIPREIHEAALIDGAGPWRRFLHVQLPLLREVGLVSALLCITGAFKAFDLFYVIGAKDGAPGGSTWIMATWIYKRAYGDSDLGYGAALSVIFTLIVLGVTLLFRALTRGVRRVEF
ncbi:MAG: sugar ABC transporter permease [Planctomycetes bacterium]|nr:sugar ABC transporter permease [Planctomycetota bacterium]